LFRFLVSGCVNSFEDIEKGGFFKARVSTKNKKGAALAALGAN